MSAYHKKETLPEMKRFARIEIVNHHSWTARVQVLVEGAEQILEKKRSHTQQYLISTYTI